MYGIQQISADILQKQQVIADTFKNLDLIPKSIRTTEAVSSVHVYARGP